MDIKYSTRKLFKVGGSRIIRLPADWLNNQGKGNFEITMVYNDKVLVMASCGNADIATNILKKYESEEK